jgi:hypothetical protein
MIPQGWLYAAVFAAGLGAGAWLADNALSAEHEQYKAGVAKDATDRALAVLLALEAAGEQVKAGEARISKQREDNAKANVELDRINHCLKSGTCGLRVAARCPSVPNPTAGDSASGDTATGARLDALAGWRYLDFRRGYAEQLKVLRLCKAYGETQSKKPSQ